MASEHALYLHIEIAHLGHIGVRHLCDMYIIKMTDILSMPVISLECQWAVTHAARGRDGRQEGRERGYYNLHRNLNKSLLHTLFR